eukprot:418574_1
MIREMEQKLLDELDEQHMNQNDDMIKEKNQQIEELIQNKLKLTEMIREMEQKLLEVKGVKHALQQKDGTIRELLVDNTKLNQTIKISNDAIQNLMEGIEKVKSSAMMQSRIWWGELKRLKLNHC